MARTCNNGHLKAEDSVPFLVEACNGLALINYGDNEVRLWLANHSLGKPAVGGKLFVTNKRIVFIPNRLDSVTGGKRLEIAASEVTNIGEITKDLAATEAFSGAWRNRLMIEGSSGVFGYFVVNQLPKVIADLNSAIS